MRQGHMPVPAGPGMGSMHERRTSSQSMHSESNMNRNFTPAGRGRGYPPQQFGAQSPAQGYRQLANQPRPGSNVPAHFQPPNSPYARGRGSPAPQMPPQPHMGGNSQMQQYGGYPPQHMPPQQVYLPFPILQQNPRSSPHSSNYHVSGSRQGCDFLPHPTSSPKHPEALDEHVLTNVNLLQYMQQFDPNSGYYQPYGYPYPQYPGQGPPPSPRHGGAYPNPYSGAQGQMQPPYHATDMSRSASQSSQRPPSVSSLGGSQTPALPSQPPPTQTPSNAQGAPGQSSNFVRPVKKSAVKITDASGKEINFGNKGSPSPGPQATSNAPVIVSTPSAPTPPPRAPSAQHGRSESRTPVQTAEERKNAFQEQVKRQLEEKRKAEEAAAAKDEVEKDQKHDAEKAKAEQAEAAAKAQASEEAEATKAKEAAASAEKAAAQATQDEDAKKAAEAAKPETINDGVAETKDVKEETEEERFEREIAEMEAAEKAEEEREKAFQEKRKKEKDAAAKLQADKDANVDAELKRQEREAEAREEAREREREAEKNKDSTDAEPDEEAKAMFDSLAKPALGPGASATESGAETSHGDDNTSDSSSMPPPTTRGAPKPKPTHLKLETNKRVEAPEPTPGMQALKSARFLELKDEVKYPEGISSPNPALNNASARKGRAYDKDFLLQFQNVFKEKPSVDWDQKVKETLGPSDEPSSARAGSARTPSGMGGRTPSSRGGPPMGGFPMGQFGSGPGQQVRTLPPGTTSEQRFAQASGMPGGRGGMAMPGFQRTPSALGMGGPGAIGRSGPMQGMSSMGSPRQQSSRGGKGGSRRGDRTMSKKEEAELANKMPLTAHMEIKGLEKSTTGWKATSLGAAPTSVPDLSGHLSPELVQRKVKAALNKMTPEKFDKISDQILDIASQSKTESDGRTLRQVIQLTFEKACDEAHWAGMYAQFCHKMLTAMSSDIRDETITDKNGAAVTGGALFRKYLLNRCQEEFERGWQANLPEKPEGDSQEAALLSDEYYVAAAAKRRGLGLIQFIGQLYKLRMLTIRIMHECVMRLLNFEGEPDESAIENLTTLLGAVGDTMDEEEQGRSLMNTYFQRIDEKILKSNTLASRPRFMVLDLIDLRKAGWKGKNDGSKGPKTIDEIHAEAAAAQAKAEQERQRTSHRGGHGGRMPQGRGDARNFSGHMPPPVDHNKTTVGMDDLRRLQNRGSSQRQTGGNLGPGGSLGSLSARSGSRRGLGPQSSGNTTRTNTPPVDSKDKKEEPAAQQNAFSALAQLDSGEGGEDPSEAASPPAARNRSKSPAAADKAEDNA
nr:eukaryotic translation initiation factor 4 gamma [Quercus suber]